MSGIKKNIKKFNNKINEINKGGIVYFYLFSIYLTISYIIDGYYGFGLLNVLLGFVNYFCWKNMYCKIIQEIKEIETELQEVKGQ